MSANTDLNQQVGLKVQVLNEKMKLLIELQSKLESLNDITDSSDEVTQMII